MSEVLIDRDGPVATVTLNRPDALNSMDDAMMVGIVSAFTELQVDPDIRAIIVTGAGRAFCAGGDVKGMGTRGAQGPEERLERLRLKQHAAVVMRENPKLLIGAINGHAMGAGFGMALCCDFRIAARGAKFATSFANIAFSGDFGTAWNLNRMLGPDKALELMVLNPTLSAEQVAELGLVSKVVEPEDLMAEARALAERIAAGPSLAFGYMKKNLNAANTASFSEMVEIESTHQVRTVFTEDHAEARAAFAEKRAPVFKGR